MEPKNKKERSKSLLKFIALFSATIILILLASFFDFNVLPIKENKILRSKIAKIEKEKIYQQEFSEKVSEISKLIDSLDTPGQNIQYFNALINSKLVDLQKSIPEKKATNNYKMYVDFVQTFVDIQELKTKLKSYDGVDEKLDEYRQELDRVSAELDKSQRYLSALRR